VNLPFIVTVLSENICQEHQLHMQAVLFVECVVVGPSVVLLYMF
jgi:hypothetical protein